MPKLKPIEIELNYDPTIDQIDHRHEGEGSRQAGHDARHVRIESDDGSELEPGSLQLLPPPQPPGMICPILIHKGEQTLVRGGIEIRAELNVKELERYGSIEKAARYSFPVLFVAKKRGAKDSDKPLKCKGLVRINLNSIRWSWEPLVREPAKGKAPRAIVQRGSLQKNSPIEVDLDGSDLHGVRLILERHVLEQDGKLQPAEADFTHYLAPHEHEIDFSILRPDPLPWDPPQPKRQVETIWWAQTLPDDHEIRQRLPVETEMRVKAWPANSIQERFEGNRIRLEPDDAAELAIREIPLQLGLVEWQADVISPNPNEPPVELLDKQPWESIDVEVSVFGQSKQGSARYLQSREIDWELVTEEGSDPVGAVKNEAGERKLRGRFTTDDRGRVKFKFCPAKKNSLFRGEKEGTSFHAKFNFYLTGPTEQEHGPKIASKSSGDRGQPTFVLDWAPKFDVQVFKLPYFTKEGSLDPAFQDPVVFPSEATIKAIPVRLEPDQKLAYRNIFRSGGTIVFKPFVKGMPDGKAEPEEFGLRDYRLVIGEDSRYEADARQIEVIPAANGEPLQVKVAGTPTRSGKAAELELKVEIKPHEDVRKLLDQIVTAAESVDKETGGSTGVADEQQGKLAGSGEFRRSGIRFYNSALQHFAHGAQNELAQKLVGVFCLLRAALHFLPLLARSWKRTGQAVELHRQSYQRTLDNIQNFYYDFLKWGKVGEWLEKQGWFAKAQKFANPAASLVQMGYKVAWAKAGQAFVGKILKKFESQRTALERDITNASRFVREAQEAQAAATQSLSTARTAARTHAASYSNHVNELVAKADELERAIAAAGTGPHAPEVTRQLGQLRSEFEAAARRTSEARDKVVVALGTPNQQGGHQAAIRARMLAESRLQGEQARRLVLDSALQEANEQQGRLMRITSQTVTETSADDVQNELEALIATLNRRPPDEPPNVRAALDHARLQLVSEVTEDAQIWEGAAESVRRLRDGLNRTSHVTGRSLSVIPPQQGVITSVFLNRLTTQLGADEANLQHGLTAMQDLLEQGRKNLETQVRASHALLKAQRAFFDEALSDGVKAGQQTHLEMLKKALAPETPAPAPPEERDTISRAFQSVWSGLLSLLSMLVRALDYVTFGFLSWAMSWLKKLLHVLFSMIGLLLQLTARIGAKIAEAFLAMLDWLRHSWRMASGFESAASQAGLASYSHCGVQGETLFGFSYLGEQNAMQRMRTACNQAAASQKGFFDSSSELIDTALRASYDDAYPKLLLETKQAFLKLTDNALSLSHLQSPPCESDCSDRLRFVDLAGRSLENDINDYLSAFDLAGSDQQSWGQSAIGLWTVVGWNSRDIDSLCDWAGFIGSWGFRLLALVTIVAGAATGVGLTVAIPASLAFVGHAELVSAIMAVARLAVHAWSCHFYATIYPRDVSLLPAIAYAVAFEPAAQQFQPASANEIIAGYKRPPRTG